MAPQAAVAHNATVVTAGLELTLFLLTGIAVGVLQLTLVGSFARDSRQGVDI